MTKQYRHRRSANPANAFPNPIEPGELSVNTANRSLVVGDADAATIGVPLPLLAVRFFDVRGIYQIGDMVVQAGTVYRALVVNGPGTFNPSHWTVMASGEGDFVLRAGDTMTGFLTLHAYPVLEMHAVNKGYIDALLEGLGGGLGARRSAMVPWTHVNYRSGGSGGGIEDAPADGILYGRKDEAWFPVPPDTYGIGEAPMDGVIYGRQNGVWVPETGGGSSGEPGVGTFVRIIGDEMTGDLRFATPGSYGEEPALGVRGTTGGSDAWRLAFYYEGIMSQMWVPAVPPYYPTGWWSTMQQLSVLDAPDTPEYPGLRFARMVVNGEVVKPGGGEWATSADARIKTVEGDYKRGLAEITKLRPVQYRYRGNDTPIALVDGERDAPAPLAGAFRKSPHFAAALHRRTFTGLVAQEVEDVFPEMVRKRPGFIDGEAVDDMREIDRSSLVLALVNAVKELNARVEALEEQI